jgi:hypothetical protein
MSSTFTSSSSSSSFDACFKDYRAKHKNKADAFVSLLRVECGLEGEWVAQLAKVIDSTYAQTLVALLWKRRQAPGATVGVAMNKGGNMSALCFNINRLWGDRGAPFHVQASATVRDQIDLIDRSIAPAMPAAASAPAPAKKRKHGAISASAAQAAAFAPVEDSDDDDDEQVMHHYTQQQTQGAKRQAIEVAMRRATHEAKRLQTTVGWMARFSEFNLEKSTARRDQLNLDAGRKRTRLIALLGLLREFYKCAGCDLLLPQEERLLDFGLQREAYGSYSLVMFSVSLESIINDLLIQDDGCSGFSVPEMPEALATFYAHHASLSQINTQGNTSLMLLATSEYLGTAQAQLVRAWLARASSMLAVLASLGRAPPYDVIDNVNAEGHDLLGLLFRNPGLAGTKEADATYAPTSLVFFECLDINVPRASFSESASIIARLVKSDPVPLALICSLLASQSVAVDFCVTDTRGRTIDALAKEACAWPTCKKERLQVAEQLAAHCELVFKPNLSLMEQMLQVETPLADDLCSLVRQYMDGSGNPFPSEPAAAAAAR